MQMVNVIYGKKGMGKTKILVEEANKLASAGHGDVVFIDDSNQLMYDLKHEIRFVNVTDFPVSDASSFLGFICGIIAEDYDIDGIFIDGLTYILKQKLDTLQDLFASLKKIAEKYNIKVVISINGEPEIMPEYLKEYIA
jgi:RecA/RadA recombinase